MVDADLSRALREAAGDNGYPLGGMGQSAVDAIADRVKDSADLETLSELAEAIGSDPMLTQQLSDRVYDLMREDFRLQQERSRGYGRGF
ncbi:hypothetical protein [Synechococcus sp. PCC 7336]|uniref:hypothetical protein n=1 Tax=Synechococcus sp. PCC 7336 TaxID=195250 RepID=UPI00034AE737|nr:hypothetical protein [Synechococcus sp. PCC 7336]